MKTQKWNEIRSGSKIHLKNDTTFETLGNENYLAKNGEYYIIGFWGNLCGLSINKEDVYKQNCQFHILSTKLTEFEGII